jgi:uncharacterized protein YutE (UPF0331/DUF86 family)
MVDEQVVLAKISQARRHLGRVRTRLPADRQTFLDDVDTQDIVVHNIWLALQSCIDLAAHVVADEGLGQPRGLVDLFELLGRGHILDPDLSRRLRQAAGLRNIIVHEYVRLDLDLVYNIASNDLADLDAFLLAVAEHFHLDSPSDGWE